MMSKLPYQPGNEVAEEVVETHRLGQRGVDLIAELGPLLGRGKGLCTRTQPWVSVSGPCGGGWVGGWWVTTNDDCV